ncbi:hypothetical protein C8N43_0402 [Litoreibacter ponti]|uniref:Nickel/cobalt transporter regulator n=1 Tax=Litoreibacter ponti TaxID=1510457 RepID=A0A2T6BI74_9RHOB|nr:RcnB family protein [Litoreibacter ponti]PTX55760.1 hypothetical protein C8N43_0402 [Litoreibacter ponti]
MRAILISAITLTLAASPALAKDKPFKKNKLRGAQAQSHCPPGLAKKSPACVPPGLAKKQGLQRGDRYTGDGRILRDYGRFGLPRLDPGQSYYRLGDTIIAVDDDTRRVLDVIAVLSRVSN